MLTAELNTVLAEDVLSSVPPEVCLPDLTDEIEAEDCYHEHQRAVARGNRSVKDQLRDEARLGRYLDRLVKEAEHRGSRDATSGQFTGSERVLPEWATKHRKYWWCRVGNVPGEARERHFTETEAADDDISRQGLLDFYALYLEEQEDDIDDEGTDDEETGDDDQTDNEGTDEGTDDYPTQKTLTLRMSLREARVFEDNRSHIKDVVLAELRRLVDRG